MYKDGFIYGLKNNRFKGNVASVHSNKVYSYPYKLRLNLSIVTGQNKVAEDQYVLDNHPPDLNSIPLEFVFYDEKDEKIVLSQ